MAWLPALFLALTPTAFAALGNIVDGKISRNLGLHAVVFYGTAANLVFVPLFLFFGPAETPATAAAWAAGALAGVAEVLYLYPYVRALASMDTSVVTALFGLGKFMVPVLAYFLAGESLPPGLYAGFFLIVGAAVAMGLSRSPHGKLRLGAAFWNMLACSGILALSNVAIKVATGGGDPMGWVGFFVWSQAVSGATAFALLAWPGYRRGVAEGWAPFRAYGRHFAAQSALAVGCAATGVLAISQVPVTFVTGVASSQPFMVLLFSLALARFWPGFLNEGMTRRELARKSVFFACMVAGVATMTARVG